MSVLNKVSDLSLSILKLFQVLYATAAIRDQLYFTENLYFDARDLPILNMSRAEPRRWYASDMRCS